MACRHLLINIIACAYLYCNNFVKRNIFAITCITWQNCQNKKLKISQRIEYGPFCALAMGGSPPGIVGINSQGGPPWDLSIWGILEIHLSGRQLSNWRRQGINRMRWSRSIFLKFPWSRRGRGGQLAAAASSSNALSGSWQEPQEYSNLYCAC